MDSKKKVEQKGNANHSKPATRPGAEQTHSGANLGRHEGETVQAPKKQGEVKKTEQTKSGKK
jgi:hypothetical protein